MGAPRCEVDEDTTLTVDAKPSCCVDDSHACEGAFRDKNPKRVELRLEDLLSPDSSPKIAHHVKSGVIARNHRTSQNEHGMEDAAKSEMPVCKTTTEFRDDG